MPPKSFLKNETQVAINCLDKETDESMYKGMSQEISKLRKEKETLERSILAFEEASTIKVDKETQGKLDFYFNQVKEETKRYETREKSLEELYELSIKEAEEKMEQEIQEVKDKYSRQLNKAKDIFDKKKKQIEEKFENNRDHYNSQIEAISGKKVAEPERILRAKIQLRELISKLEYKEMFLSAFDNAGKSGFTHILPETTWKVNPELEASALKELQMRKENPMLEL